MNIEMIQKLMTDREMKQPILKVQPVNIFMINIQEKKSVTEKKIHEICEGEKMNYKIGGDYVASDEEPEMRSSTG